MKAFLKLAALTLLFFLFCTVGAYAQKTTTKKVNPQGKYPATQQNRPVNSKIYNDSILLKNNRRVPPRMQTQNGSNQNTRSLKQRPANNSIYRDSLPFLKDNRMPQQTQNQNGNYRNSRSFRQPSNGKVIYRDSLYLKKNPNQTQRTRKNQ